MLDVQGNPRGGTKNGLSPALSRKFVDYLVVDDFVSDPARIRQSALESGFGTWAPNKGEVGSSLYAGMNFWGAHAPMLRGIAKAMGEPIYPNSMFFRVTNLDTEGAYVHSDREAGDFTAIVYLSEHAKGSSGTGFYQHRETGMTRMPSFDEMRADPEWFAKFKTEMVDGKPEHWKLTTLVPGDFNRALIFEAPLFHSRLPKHGFGDSAETGRMVWVAHFGLEASQ